MLCLLFFADMILPHIIAFLLCLLRVIPDRFYAVFRHGKPFRQFEFLFESLLQIPRKRLDRLACQRCVTNKKRACYHILYPPVIIYHRSAWRQSVYFSFLVTVNRYVIYSRIIVIMKWLILFDQSAYKLLH